MSDDNNNPTSLSDSRIQPPPTKTDSPYVKDLVLKDFHERVEFGYNKYGTFLQVENGRDPLIDIYQEMWDGLFYIRQELFKRYGK